jgi:hypothetical protein
MVNNVIINTLGDFMRTLQPYSNATCMKILRWGCE